MSYAKRPEIFKIVLNKKNLVNFNLRIIIIINVGIGLLTILERNGIYEYSNCRWVGSIKKIL